MIWNKGKTYDEEYKRKVSEGMKLAWKEGRFTKNESHFKKGSSSWNKGKKGAKSHMTELWKNLEFKKQQSERLKEAWKKRKKND